MWDYVADFETHTCRYKSDKCAADTYLSGDVCVTAQSCTSAGRYLYQQDGKRLCLNAHECGAENGFLTSEDSTACVAMCGSKTIQEELVDGTTVRKCVSRDTCAGWIREYIKSEYEHTMYALCVDSCPIEYSVLTQDTHECQSCREITGWQKLYWDPNANACVEECPERTHHCSDYICWTSYSMVQNGLYWNSTTSTCVSSCP